MNGQKKMFWNSQLITFWLFGIVRLQFVDIFLGFLVYNNINIQFKLFYAIANHLSVKKLGASSYLLIKINNTPKQYQ